MLNGSRWTPSPPCAFGWHGKQKLSGGRAAGHRRWAKRCWRVAAMTDRLRWIKFWPADWSRDPALRICGLAARGLWIELLAVAHEAEPYGHVLVSGRAPSVRQIAAIAGTTERDAAKLLQELEKAGVFSRTEAGVIYSRRMVRDHKTREEARDFGKRGGNPRLKGADNGGVNPSLKLQEAEAEVETEKKNPPPPRKRGAAPMEGFAEFWRLYPRKIGKGAAERAWPRAVQAAKGDWQLIVASLQDALDLHRLDMRDGGRFCPHPSTWLNGKRWLDGLEPELLGDAT